MSPADQAPLPHEALAELGMLSLADETLPSLLDRIVKLTKSIIPGAGEVSVTLIRDDLAGTPASTGLLALKLDERQYERGSGPCLEAARTGKVQDVADLTTEERWPGWVYEARALGLRSSLSVPIPVHEGLQAALNIYSQSVHAFDEPAKQVGSTFAAYAGRAIANVDLHDSTRQLAEQLRQALSSRAVIDQAIGMLMAQRRLSSTAAFELLVSLSQKSNRKLRDVARAIVDSAPSC